MTGGRVRRTDCPGQPHRADRNVVEGPSSATTRADPRLLGAVSPEAAGRTPRRQLPLRPLVDVMALRQPRHLDAAAYGYPVILVIGSGPLSSGRLVSSTTPPQACRVLRAEGFRSSWSNSNPATIMTDPEFPTRPTSSRSLREFVELVIAKERPDALLATLGGQTHSTRGRAARERRAGTLRGRADRCPSRRSSAGRTGSSSKAWSKGSPGSPEAAGSGPKPDLPLDGGGVGRRR